MIRGELPPVLRASLGERVSPPRDVNAVYLVGTVEELPEPTMHRGDGARFTFRLSTLNDRHRRDDHEIVVFGEDAALSAQRIARPGARVEVLGQNRVSHAEPDGRSFTRVSIDARRVALAEG